MDNKLLSRIQKLLALADPERNDSQAQIEAALDKVSQLLDQHNITMQDVEGYEPDKDLVHRLIPLWDIPNDGTLIQRKHNQWLMDLTYGVGHANYCHALYSHLGATYIGRRQDVEIASFMLESLFRRIVELSKQEMYQYMRDYKEKNGKSAWHIYGRRHPKVWRRGWLEGAAMALQGRLCQPREEASQKAHKERNENTTAIVSMHTEALREFTKEQFPDVPELDQEKVVESPGAGWEQGHKVGKQMDIQQGIGTTDENVPQLKGAQ